MEGAGGPLCECALLALARSLSMGLVLYIERDRLCLAEFGGRYTRHLARFPLVCPALSPPAKLNSVE